MVKKISVIQSNNGVLNDNYRHLNIPPDISDKKLIKLRKYVLQNIPLNKYSGPELVVRSLEWVSTQWKHDGMNEPPEGVSSYQILMNVVKGHRYRCVEYGKVLADLLQSLGYISRGIGLKTKDVAYGGFGMGHVASEVWIDRIRKWIFLDPQFGIYVKHEGTFLNFYDMYLLKRDGKFDEIEFIPTNGYLKYHSFSADKVVEDYKAFIQRYFGYIDTSYLTDDKTKISLTLPLEANYQFLTFQGMAVYKGVFTEKVDDFYFPLNEVSILMNYRTKHDFLKIFKKHKIKTNTDFMEKMHLFCALPKYDLNFINNMPWFHYYEVRLDQNEKWKRLKKEKYKWDLRDGHNKFEIRGVNKAGISGPSTVVEIEYR